MMYYIERTDEMRCTRPGPPGRLSALSVFLFNSIFYGAFVWARRALNSQKRRFPARAVGDGTVIENWDTGKVRALVPITAIGNIVHLDVTPVSLPTWYLSHLRYVPDRQVRMIPRWRGSCANFSLLLIYCDYLGIR
jgi:hypothetical protein